MNRPTKVGDETRDLTIRFRVTRAEKNQIWQLAEEAKILPSDYLRLKVLGTKPVRKLPSPEREVLLKFLAELGKIGSNVNQLARAVNRRQGHIEERGPTIEVITDTLRGIHLMTTHIMKLLTHGD